MKWLIVMLVLCFTEATIYPSIPPHLLQCYRRDGPKVTAPRRIDVLLSLLRKLELNSQLDLRLFSAALLRSLRLDGIEQAPNPIETEFVTPYRASAFHFFKYKLLMDLFVPSQNLLDVNEILLPEEKCTLHKLLSSTVQAWERGDEPQVCPMSMELYRNTNNSTGRSRSRCPIEDGVIHTEWGTIAPGVVIAAVTASLEAQRVSVTDILNANPFKGNQAEPLMAAEWELDIETINMVKNTPSVVDADISNVWVATLAGDLAEVIVNQGPRTPNITLGSNNRWNDTLLPRDYYLFPRNDSVVDYQFTDAEILAGIDGLILAQYVPQWISQRSSLRLTQVLEMYYSNEGSSFDPDVKACNREALFTKVFDRSQLLSESSSFAHVLALTQGTVYVAFEQRDRTAEASVVAFVSYATALLKQHQRFCSTPSSSAPTIDMVVTTDGAWKSYHAEQFMSWVGGAIELGSQPSTLSLVHGNTGHWIVPPSRNLVEVFGHLSNYTDDYPHRLIIPNVISTLLRYSENRSLDSSESQLSVSPSTVLLVISPSDRPSVSETERSRDLTVTLRRSYFDTYFAFAATELTPFKNINYEYMDYSELFVQTDSSSVQDVINAVNAEVISATVPKAILGPHCPVNGTEYIQVPFEDFVSPGKEVRYRIHPHYMTLQPMVIVNFRNSGLGSILVCHWRGGEGDKNCQTISESQSHSFNLTAPCQSEGFCTPAHFSVAVVSTLNLCANKDCRVPQQVSYYLQHSGLRCLALRSSAARISYFSALTAYAMISLFIYAFLYNVVFMF